MKVTIGISAAFLFLTISLRAQWTQIPNPGVSANIVLPVGNNKIIYAGSQQTTPSGGGKVIAHMADDFGTKTLGYTQSGGTGTTPIMVGAASYNDSTVCFNHNVFGYGIGYTTNGFKNAYLKGVGGYGSYSTFNTSRHLFYLFYSNDTVVFKRVNTGAQQETIIYLPKYYSGFNSSFLPKVSFINDSTGFILARYTSNTSKSVLLKTTNYGDTWNELLIDSVNQIVSYSFPSSQTGYIVKTDGSFLKTTDDGANWYAVGSPSVASPFVVAFSNDSLGYVGGANGSMTRTNNGGMSWSTENTGTTANITGIYTFGPVAYYRTATNLVFKNVPKGVSIQKNEASDDLKIYPNPFNNLLTIETGDAEGKVTIRVADIFGRNFYSTEVFCECTHISKTLDLGFLNSGVYFISVESKNQRYSQKVILNK